MLCCKHIQIGDQTAEVVDVRLPEVSSSDLGKLLITNSDGNFELVKPQPSVVEISYDAPNNQLVLGDEATIPQVKYDSSTGVMSVGDIFSGKIAMVSPSSSITGDQMEAAISALVSSDVGGQDLTNIKGLTSNAQMQLDGKINNPTVKQAGQSLTYNGEDWIASTINILPSQAGQANKFLKTDGNATLWEGINEATVAATGTATEEVTYIIITKAGNSVEKKLAMSDMVGATSATVGVHGAVPAPGAGDENKYLTGAGTWVTLPQAMIFKGTLGIGGTITDLPIASSALMGQTYKVITNGEYASTWAKIGDLFTCSDTPEWVHIPSGDEPSGTVTNIATDTGLTGGPITTSGTIGLAAAYGDTINPYGSKTRNYILSAPVNADGLPSFRAMDPSDMPDMMGATASAAGVKGAVPAPASANRLDYLRGDGTWQTISVVADALAHKLTLNISIA